MISFQDLGTIDYSDAWKMQLDLFEKAVSNKEQSIPVENKVLICEHPHVITLGRKGVSDNLLFSEHYLKERGVQFFHIDRGGDITYHGPGQIVVYPIFDLESFGIGLKEYVFRLEEIVIKFLEKIGIEAYRIDSATGVWIRSKEDNTERKVCAIGVRSKRFVTMHGFALNVSTDLSYFSLINPCGFTEKGVTSIHQEKKNSDISLEFVKKEIENLFNDLFK